MPNLHFYATPSDLEAVLDFVLHESGCMVFESYSVPGSGLRRFESSAQVLEAFRDGANRSLGLMLYSLAMGGRYRIRRFTLRKTTSAVAAWRETIEGWGLIQLELRGTRGKCLAPCHTNHNSEARARKWESTSPDFPPLAEWDFAAVTRISNRINRHIRGRLAVARYGSRPILREAHSLLQEEKIELSLT